MNKKIDKILLKSLRIRAELLTEKTMALLLANPKPVTTDVTPVAKTVATIWRKR